jgi:hypothetical protein
MLAIRAWLQLRQPLAKLRQAMLLPNWREPKLVCARVRRMDYPTWVRYLATRALTLTPGTIAGKLTWEVLRFVYSSSYTVGARLTDCSFALIGVSHGLLPVVE